jgi:hypothetical protein
MTNQIKNFILEGEKELKDSLLNEWGVDNRASDSFDNWIIKKSSSRQISLIKMIVEMVESEKKEEYLYHDEYYHSNHECDVLTHNQALDTISSKLKELTDGK